MGVDVSIESRCTHFLRRNSTHEPGASRRYPVGPSGRWCKTTGSAGCTSTPPRPNRPAVSDLSKFALFWITAGADRTGKKQRTAEVQLAWMLGLNNDTSRVPPSCCFRS